jgi:DNA helicase II / ATP-dependent DNA helicase PcrA
MTATRLSHLNAPQREAVLTTEGPVLVLAGAGSGKTRVITHRIAHLIDERVPARAILAMTFTNKAATEMKDRVVEMVGAKALAVTLSTFHAFGAELLREHIHLLGWPKKFAIVDTADQLALIRRAMRERQIDAQAFDARKVLTLISRAKNSGATPEPKPEGQGDDTDLVAHLVYPLYQLALKAQGAVDFDDLLLFPSQLLEQFDNVKQSLVRRFRYVMVDEYQDTNSAQLTLLKHLVGADGNVCAVGDDDQCIYSWRGAQVRNILDFEQHFKNPKEIRLEQNYRSTPTILEAANAAIAHNPQRRAKRMWSDQPRGPKILCVVAPSEEEEARYVARQVKEALSDNVKPDEIAVLYRTNGQARLVEESLREKSVFYEVVGGTEFFDQREIRDVVAYFKVLANPKDALSLLRIVNVPPRGIGDVTIERLSAWASSHEIPLNQALERAHEIEQLPVGAAEKVAEFVALIAKYRARLTKGNLAGLTTSLLDEIQFEAFVRSNAPSPTAADKKVQSVRHVVQSLEQFEKREGPKASLLMYLNRFALDDRNQEDDVDSRAGCVSLMTLHSAKGLEWKLVFLIGLEEELLPHGGMQGESMNLEEERRLFYVGMTRARERLVLTRSSMRVRRGRELQRTPSRFLNEIPAELTESLDLDAPPPGPPTEAEVDFFKSLRERLKASKQGPGDER